MSAEKAGVIAANDTANSTVFPAINEDILAVIHKMKSAVDDGFDELKRSLSSLKSALSPVSEHVSTTEDAVESHEKRD